MHKFVRWQGTAPAVHQQFTGSSVERAHPRRTVLQAALLHSPDRVQLCLVRDLSESGMRAKVYRPISDYASLKVEFPAVTLPGLVVWNTPEEVGIRFEASDALAALVAGQAAAADASVRAPRIALSVQGAVQVGGRTLAAELVDLSQSGAKILASGPIACFDACVLLVPGLGTANGHVRWLADGAVGIQFDRRLPARELEDWLESRCDDLGSGGARRAG